MKWADDLVAFLKFWNNNSSQIVERVYCRNSYLAWNVRGSHSEVETWVGFTYVFLDPVARSMVSVNQRLIP